MNEHRDGRRSENKKSPVGAVLSERRSRGEYEMTGFWLLEGEEG